MSSRRPFRWLILALVAGSAACASSGSGAGAYADLDCYDAQGDPAYSHTYGYAHGYSFALADTGGPCSEYPRGYYPEYAVAPLAARHVTPAQARPHGTHTIERPGTDPIGGSSFSDSSSSSSSAWSAPPSSPRMDPVPVSNPGHTTTTVQPREH